MSLTIPLHTKQLLLALLILSSFFYQVSYAEDEANSTKPVYIELTPDFIVNYSSSSTRLKYIKTKITLRSDSTKEALVNDNLPLVQDALIMFLSSRTEEQVTGAIAREKTREEAAVAINQVLKEETNQEPIKDVLFSSFVTQ
ncbi:flagellar basal body-associated FliL family protein [Marinomonas transparens]|uniref:Flagellar protein FliL n=1 Tax=Marinomonas transparens TaxID=2795388 RepID=A0A934JQA8_9GAMM|nr:flagellar basal body-associated FliL family protein [Marinomonas transparens]MBJ7537828.1 flagellar basal body-associated FliL family protein [Marinomonas transparens]